ncbi:hypothetical protein F4779DRAFT_324699 [Xylariaceae sp. FL0662B]|nr:hypothetical protein F4779DRAFT_324699 [Xylariaceae sp. FL0662B]
MVCHFQLLVADAIVLVGRTHTLPYPPLVCMLSRLATNQLTDWFKLQHAPSIAILSVHRNTIGNMGFAAILVSTRQSPECSLRHIHELLLVQEASERPC